MQYSWSERQILYLSPWLSEMTETTFSGRCGSLIVCAWLMYPHVLVLVLLTFCASALCDIEYKHRLHMTPNNTETVIKVKTTYITT